MSFLDETGLSYFWSKIKQRFLLITGGTLTGKLTLPSLAIAGSNVADFPVASGTSGSWTYVKYQSGIAVCSRRTEFSGAYIGSKQGELYVSGGDVVTAISYPFSFTTQPTEVVTIRTGSKYVFPMGTTHNTAAKSGGYTLSSPIAYNTSQTAVSGVANQIVMGRWK